MTQSMPLGIAMDVAHQARQMLLRPIQPTVMSGLVITHASCLGHFHAYQVISAVATAAVAKSSE
jgi:hypothetical protein